MARQEKAPRLVKGILNFPPRYNVNKCALVSPTARLFFGSHTHLFIAYLSADECCRTIIEKGERRIMKEAQKQKQVIIDEIKDKFERAESAVVIDYIGITVAEADAMRKKLREADVDYTIYKNTLVKRAIAGTEYEALSGVLEGPSGFAFSYDDATAPARVLNDAIKEYKKMEFKGGIIEGTYYDKNDIQTIAAIPSRDVLISKFMGSIQSPVANFARVVAQIAEQKEAEA